MKFIKMIYEFHKTDIIQNALRDGVIDGAALSASMGVRRHVAEGDFVFGLAASGGVEVDFAKKWTASAGFQITRYGNTDEFINDISFVVNSWSFGLGGKYQVSDKVAVQAAFFQTNYDKYTSQPNAMGEYNTYTRTNRVLAVGANIDF